MTHKEFTINGPNKRPIVADIRFIDAASDKPVIIFCHGFKGFKDWGGFNLMADFLAKSGYIFIKFNFSHNGGTVEQPVDFPDLDAFAKNNYSKELDDLGYIIDVVLAESQLGIPIKPSSLFLMGHSRGGGIALLKSGEDPRIDKVVTLAAVDDFESRFPAQSALRAWKAKGVTYIQNGRTNQQMPLDYQFYTDFISNKTRLDIASACKRINIPVLAVHGLMDKTVAPKAAYNIQTWCDHAEIHLVDNLGHTFGLKHPWVDLELPKKFTEVLMRVDNFLKLRN